MDSEAVVKCEVKCLCNVRTVMKSGRDGHRGLSLCSYIAMSVLVSEVMHRDVFQTAV